MLKKFYLFFLCAAALFSAAADTCATVGKNAEFSLFRSHRQEAAPDQSCVRLTSEPEALTVEFCSFFPPGEPPLPRKSKTGKTDLFGGEHVELLLSPAPGSGVYFHFAVDPAGNLYRARCRDRAWEPAGMSVKVWHEPGCWHARFRIPWHVLETAFPARGEEWRANFCRHRNAAGIKGGSFSWSGSRDFHALNEMGKLIFSQENARTPELLLRKLSCDGDELHLELAEPFAGKITVSGLEGAWKEEGKNSPLSRTFRRRKEGSRFVPLEKSVLLTISLADKTGTISRPVPLRFPVEDPLVPDRFYYLPQEQLHCRTAWGTGTLRVLDRFGNAMREKKDYRSGDELEIGSLPPGNYAVEYITPTRRTLRTICRTGAPEMLILPDGPLTLAGARFQRGDTPLYLWGTTNTSEAIFPFSPENTLTHGNHGAKNAVRIVPAPAGKIIRVPVTGRLIGDEAAFYQEFESRVREMDLSQPALFRIAYEAWLPLFIGKNTEEMKPVKDLPAWYAELFCRCKKQSPQMICSLQLDRAENIPEFSRACDLFEYASPQNSYAQDDILPSLEKELAGLRKTLKEKPLIFWLGGSIPDGLCRTPEELRAAAYFSILGGAAGNVVHVGDGGIPGNRTRMWSFLAGMSREICRFYSRFITGKPIAFPLPATFAGEARKCADGTILLVVVNRLNQENRLTLADGKTRLFTPYEPAVFMIKEEGKESLSVLEMSALEEKEL